KKGMPSLPCENSPKISKSVSSQRSALMKTWRQKAISYPQWAGAHLSPGKRRMCSGNGSCGNWKRSEEHTSELQSRFDLVCRLLLEKKKKNKKDVEVQ